MSRHKGTAVQINLKKLFRSCLQRAVLTLSLGFISLLWSPFSCLGFWQNQPCPFVSRAALSQFPGVQGLNLLSITSPFLVAFISNHTEAPDYREFHSRILIFVFYFLFPFLLHKYFSLRMSRCRWMCMQTLSFLFVLEWLCCKPGICFITFRGLSISSFNSRALH